MVDLGSLSPTYSESYGHSINDLGQVAGFSDAGAGAFSPFRWTPSGGMQDLGTLGGFTSYEFGINNEGQVTGTSDVSEFVEHAFRWTTTRGMQDLGTLGETDSNGGGDQ